MEKHEGVVQLGRLMAEALRAECSARRRVTVEETNPNLGAHQSEASTSTSNPTGTHTNYSPKNISFLPSSDTSSCNPSSQAQPQASLSLIDDIISSPTQPIPNLIPLTSEIQNPIYSKPSPYHYPAQNNQSVICNTQTSSFTQTQLPSPTQTQVLKANHSQQSNPNRNLRYAQFHTSQTTRPSPKTKILIQQKAQSTKA